MLEIQEPSYARIEIVDGNACLWVSTINLITWRKEIGLWSEEVELKPNMMTIGSP